MLSKREILKFIINNTESKEKNKNENKKEKIHIEKISKEAMELPMLIRVNGLGNTAAYLVNKEKKNEGYRSLNILLLNYLNLDEINIKKQKQINTVKNFLNYIKSLSSNEYRNLTDKVFKFAVELKNYVRLYKEK